MALSSYLLKESCTNLIYTLRRHLKIPWPFRWKTQVSDLICKLKSYKDEHTMKLDLIFPRTSVWKKRRLQLHWGMQHKYEVFRSCYGKVQLLTKIWACLLNKKFFLLIQVRFQARTVFLCSGWKLHPRFENWQRHK